MALALNAVLQDPLAAGRVLEDALPGCTVTSVAQAAGGVVLNLEFTPYRGLEDYPIQRVRIRILDNGDISAIPLGPARKWKHRFLTEREAHEEAWGHTVDYSQLRLRQPNCCVPAPAPAPEASPEPTGLCLFYPEDPKVLTWDWSSGLEEYVLMVRRHLTYEEAWRRNGIWPVEDTPHGQPENGTHPIRTGRMRQEVKRWSRSK